MSWLICLLCALVPGQHILGNGNLGNQLCITEVIVDLESSVPNIVIKGDNFRGFYGNPRVTLGGVDVTGDCTFDFLSDPQVITCTALPQFEGDYLLIVQQGNYAFFLRDEYDLTIGSAGADGASAYQIWLDAGNTGTEADFLASLVGSDGADGADGVDGADGINGTNGADGTDGLSAYQIWLDAGNTGTEVDFLASLIGLTGADGADGVDGAIGPQGPAGASPFVLNGDDAYYTSGNVGIGTDDPQETLHVNGSLRVDGSVVMARQGDIFMGQFGIGDDQGL